MSLILTLLPAPEATQVEKLKEMEYLTRNPSPYVSTIHASDSEFFITPKSYLEKQLNQSTTGSTILTSLELKDSINFEQNSTILDYNIDKINTTIKSQLIKKSIEKEQVLEEEIVSHKKRSLESISFKKSKKEHKIKIDV